jgi:hypothetical protein
MKKWLKQLTNLIWDVHKEFSAGDELGLTLKKKHFTTF